jgi:ATP-binding cassette subfamily C protein
MSKGKNAVTDFLGPVTSYLSTAGAFSLAINLLYLAGPLYMLQLYDRVVPSGSQITLYMLTLGLLLTYAALAGLDMARARVLTRASLRLDRRIADRIMMATINGPTDAASVRSEPLRDFDSVRQFLSGAGVHALFDLPWAPVYVVVIFLLHWALGAFALACCMVLVLMALVTEWRVRRPLSDANAAAGRSYRFTEMSLRNAEAIRVMGMTRSLLQRWARDRDEMLAHQVTASDRAATMQGTVRFLRLSMQSLILGLGAYLVIDRSATAGAMFAASLLLAKALQPVEQITSTWRQLLSIRAATRRLSDLLTNTSTRKDGVLLPRPTGQLAVEELTYVRAGNSTPILRGVSFSLLPGEVLGVIGPSGAGKSTLARQLVGVLAPSAGSVRLDSAEVHPWACAGLGEFVGYLPQEVELFADTVAANINRFKRGNDEATIRAARLAGVHELILRLRHGYETEVGESGTVLSGGYRQRIGLARAVYGEPSFVVLDEPSSNLDAEGDEALAQCIRELKRRGVTVVIISHRPSTISVADKLLVLSAGAVEIFGSRSDVLARLARGPQLQPVKSA